MRGGSRGNNVCVFVNIVFSGLLSTVCLCVSVFSLISTITLFVGHGSGLISAYTHTETSQLHLPPCTHLTVCSFLSVSLPFRD